MAAITRGGSALNPLQLNALPDEVFSIALESLKKKDLDTMMLVSKRSCRLAREFVRVIDFQKSDKRDFSPLARYHGLHRFVAPRMGISSPADMSAMREALNSLPQLFRLREFVLPLASPGVMPLSEAISGDILVSIAMRFPAMTSLDLSFFTFPSVTQFQYLQALTLRNSRIPGDLLQRLGPQIHSLTLMDAFGFNAQNLATFCTLASKNLRVLRVDSTAPFAIEEPLIVALRTCIKLETLVLFGYWPKTPDKSLGEFPSLRRLSLTTSVCLPSNTVLEELTICDNNLIGSAPLTPCLVDTLRKVAIYAPKRFISSSFEILFGLQNLQSLSVNNCGRIIIEDFFVKAVTSLGSPLPNIQELGLTSDCILEQQLWRDIAPFFPNLQQLSISDQAISYETLQILRSLFPRLSRLNLHEESSYIPQGDPRLDNVSFNFPHKMDAVKYHQSTIIPIDLTKAQHVDSLQQALLKRLEGSRRSGFARRERMLNFQLV